MSNILWKNFYLCFSKFNKCFPTALPPPSPSPQDHTHPTTTTTSTPLIKNLNSLLDHTSDNSTATAKSLSPSLSSDDFFSSSDDSDADSSQPDIAAVFASHRFFFPSPGVSNSIVGGPTEPDPVVAGSVAIQTISPDPYLDFRRSMQEMVDARQVFDVKAEWDYLHELLLCYLSLNPKHTHEFIFCAFSDLLVSLMANSGSHRRKPESHRRAAVPRLLL